MRIIEQIENESLEFKRQLPVAEKLATEVIAMANCKGGKIVIGYDQKTETVYSQEPNQKQEELIANIISDYCQPRPSYIISYETQVQLKDKPTLLIIEIDEGENKPYCLKNKSLEDGVFVRIGSSSRRANRQELAKLIRTGQNISFDHEELISKQAIDQSLLKDYFKLRKDIHGAPIPKITEELMQDLGLISKRGNPTVAGLLLFAKEPQKEVIFENAYIKAARFKGLEKGFFIDRQDIYGSLPEQLDAAKKFIIKNISIRGEISGTIRQDQLEYPENIIRELIVNALVHRDYSIIGSTIMISIFDDRIEVTSPGGLEAGVTTTNIESRQYSRNPTIAKRMYEMGYFDSWGQGIDNIISWSKASGTLYPIFKDENNQFSITVFSGFLSGAKGISEHKILLGKREEAVLDLLSKEQKLTSSELQSKLKISKGQAQATINKLLKSNLIQRIGNGKNTQYVKILFFSPS